MTDITPIIIAIIAALPGVAGLYVSLRRNEVDRAEFVQDAAIELIAPLKKRLAEQDAHIRELEKQLHNVIAENAILRERVRKLEAENLQLMAELERK